MTFLQRRLLIFVLAVIRHPRITLLLALLAVAGCTIFAKLRLNISTDQNKLFSADVPFFHDYLSFIHKFPENEAIYIVLQANDPNHPPAVKRWTAAADAIANRLREMPNDVRAVDDRVPLDQLGAQGLLFDDRERIRQTVADARRFIPLAKLWGEAPGVGERLLGATPMARFLGGVNLIQPDAESSSFVALLAKHVEANVERQRRSRIARPAISRCHRPPRASVITMCRTTRTIPAICCWCAFIQIPRTPR